MNNAEKAVIGIIALGAGGLALYYILKSKPAVAKKTPTPSPTPSPTSKKVCSSQYCGFIPEPIILVNQFYQNPGSGIDVWVDGQYVGQTDTSGWVFTPLFSPCKLHDVKAEGKGYVGQGKLGYFCYSDSSEDINNQLMICPYTGVFYLGISSDKPITVTVSISGPTSASITVDVSCSNTWTCVDNNCTVSGYCGNAIIKNIPSGHYTYTVTDKNGNVLWNGTEDVCGDEYNGANISCNACVTPDIYIPSWKLQ